MIYKTRDIPALLIGQHALLKRLSPSHEKYEKIAADYYNRKAGYGGEKEFDYQLKDFHPSYPYAILHDLLLKQDHTYFQIDSLLITPSAIVLFEIKNIAGKLHIKQNPTQFIRETAGGERTVLKSPIEEMERKKYYFSAWLKQRGIDAPLLDFIVLAYQNELIIENTVPDRIAFSYEIPNRLRKLEMASIFSADQITQLANELKRAHCIFNHFPLTEKYTIPANELNRGVSCSICKKLTMTRTGKSWRCRVCGYQDLHAHIITLQEWFCIQGTSLSNRQFRHFSNLGCRHIAKRLLATPFTRMTGRKRTAVYHLSPKILDYPTDFPF